MNDTQTTVPRVRTDAALFIPGECPTEDRSPGEPQEDPGPVGDPKPVPQPPAPPRTSIVGPGDPPAEEPLPEELPGLPPI